MDELMVVTEQEELSGKRARTSDAREEDETMSIERICTFFGCKFIATCGDSYFSHINAHMRGEHQDDNHLQYSRLFG
jgi:hypothetical protein